MMSGLAVAEQRSIARSPKILEPLIKADLRAAKDAGTPYWLAAGDKWNEARYGHYSDDVTGFWRWTKRFNESQTTIRTWMARAETENPGKIKALTGTPSARSGKSFETQREFRHAPKSQGGLGWSNKGEVPSIRREWAAPVDEVAQRTRQEQFRLAQEDALTRAQEREAERKLAHRLIDIGYKVLAKELHPDKLHGDKEAMRRLNRVRDFLKGAM